MVLPIFLIVAGIIVMLQPRTKRWQSRMNVHLGGDQQRLKQRANTFFLLGFAFLLAGMAMFFRLTAG